jgi:hypothetical protein
MAEDPGFIFYPGDYLRDTQCLSEKTQVSYDRIMCEHMRNICISPAQLHFFTKKLNDEEKQELMMLLIEINQGYQIKWVADSINKRRAYSESRSKNRSSKFKKDMNNICSTHIRHMDNENENENEIKKENVSIFETSLFLSINEIFNKLIETEQFRLFYEKAGLNDFQGQKELKEFIEARRIAGDSVINPKDFWQHFINTYKKNKSKQTFDHKKTASADEHTKQKL